MLVPESIECSFRELVVSEPYEKITITSICEAAHVSRTQFYTYYKNKDDLLENIIDKDIVQPMVKLHESLPSKRFKSATQLVGEQFYIKILEKRDFYSRVSTINDRTTLHEILIKKFCNMGDLMVEEVRVPDIEKEYLSYFTSVGQASLICKWIERGFDAEPNQMAQFFRKWILDYWESHIERSHHFNS